MISLKIFELFDNKTEGILFIAGIFCYVALIIFIAAPPTELDKYDADHDDFDPYD